MKVPGTSDQQQSAAAATAFRDVCAHFPTGVTAVTATDPEGNAAAFTANSFTSVSLDPPLVLVCVGTSVSSAPVMRRAENVAIHVLGANHQHVAQRFATSGLTGMERLEGIEWTPGPNGLPLIDHCTARFAGPVEHVVDAGDHMVVIVRADQAEVLAPDDPTLLFHRGNYFSHGGS
jgi:flavin reductase (DIM6/NTAB) family NADH-FMN oxidoreductase RutF